MDQSLAIVIEFNLQLLGSPQRLESSIPLIHLGLVRKPVPIQKLSGVPIHHYLVSIQKTLITWRIQCFESCGQGTGDKDLIFIFCYTILLNCELFVSAVPEDMLLVKF